MPGRPRLVIPMLVVFASLGAGPPGPSAASSELAAQEPASGSTFRHARHTGFGCQDCHAMQPGHGTLVVSTPADCQSCHHAPEQVATGCAACHQEGELRNVVYPMTRSLALSVLDAPVRRDLDFSHEVHEERACRECHEGPEPRLDATAVDCASCHEEHHDPTNEGCATCHVPAPEGAHPLEVHQTCSGSGCHIDPPFSESPRTRTGCLWCHEEQVDHEPQEECTSCHLLQGISPREATEISPLPAHFGQRYLLDIHRSRS